MDSSRSFTWAILSLGDIWNPKSISVNQGLNWLQGYNGHAYEITFLQALWWLSLRLGEIRAPWGWPARSHVGGAPPPPSLRTPAPQAPPAPPRSARAHPSAPDALPYGVSYSTPGLKWISLEKISRTSHSRPFFLVLLLMPPFSLPWRALISPAIL